MGDLQPWHSTVQDLQPVWLALIDIEELIVFPLLGDLCSIVVKKDRGNSGSQER